MKKSLTLCLALCACGLGARAQAETGYDLWLRYVPVEDQGQRRAYRRAVPAMVVPGSSPTTRVIRDELRRGLRGLLGGETAAWDDVRGDGALVVGTPSRSPLVAGLGWAEPLARLGDDGYLIRSTRLGGHPAIVIASQGERGALYGVFHFLRLIQTGREVSSLDVAQRPRLERRLLNHWDNLDGSVERGYAGASLWAWDELPDRVDPRVLDYARANASLGLNGTVINSVNASPRSLTHAYLEKAAALAQTLRPYGIRVYLAANFAAPKLMGGLPTADPLDRAVAGWWREKAAEIYRLIPDFGGFLVKANSEGQPGPQDYGRTTPTAPTSWRTRWDPTGGS